MNKAILSILLFSVLLSITVFAQVAISPSTAYTGDTLTCSLSGANPSLYMYELYKDGQKISNSNTVSNVQPGTYTCKMYVPPTPYTGTILIGESSVVVQSVIIPPKSEPHASFIASTNTPAVNQTLMFVDKSTSSPASITSRTWDFGDGTSSTAEKPQHVYLNSGTYVVNLTVVNTDGLSDSKIVNYVVYNPNLFGTLYDIDVNMSIISGANISFFNSSYCNFNDSEFTETGNCSFEQKELPDTISDDFGKFYAYLPGGMFHMGLWHSKQVDRNILINESSQTEYDPELKENQAVQDLNFEGHIEYNGNYRNGNKYMSGDPLSFIMFGVNHDSIDYTVSYLIESHVDGGSVGPWVYNGSFVNETFTVHANSKEQMTFNITVPQLSNGRYDIHVLMDNLEKWHKIGNFFVTDRDAESNVSNASANAPSVKFKNMTGTGFNDYNLINMSAANYVNQSINLTFKVTVPPVTTTIPSLTASKRIDIFEASNVVIPVCNFSSEGDEVIISAQGALITANGTTSSNELRLNVTNAYGSLGCSMDAGFVYSVSQHHIANITAKEQYSGQISTEIVANLTAWATEQQARDIWFDISQATGRPTNKSINFTGFYDGDHCTLPTWDGYCLDNIGPNTVEYNPGSQDHARFFRILLDYYYTSDYDVGFEYRSIEDGLDQGGVDWTGVPNDAPTSCWDEAANLTGATVCEQQAATERWKIANTNPQFLVINHMISEEVAKSIVEYLVVACTHTSGCSS